MFDVLHRPLQEYRVSMQALFELTGGLRICQRKLVEGQGTVLSKHVFVQVSFKNS